MLYGAIIGDIVGSRFEWSEFPAKDTNFGFFDPRCTYTDDTILTVAIAEAINNTNRNTYNYNKDLEEAITRNMVKYCRKYPNGRYGSMFENWFNSAVQAPYNSHGNGAIMRVSAIPHMYTNSGDVDEYTKLVTKITHNAGLAITCARIITHIIYSIRTGNSLDYCLGSLCTSDPYFFKDLNALSVKALRDNPPEKVNCYISTLIALACVREAKSFEEAIRLAVSIPGDTDTHASVAGSIAEVIFGIPDSLKYDALLFVPEELKATIKKLDPIN